VGREGKTVYGESWAGVQPVTFTSHQIDARINPFYDGSARKPIPLIHTAPMERTGEGDKGVQSYCYRMIATDNPENMISWPKPEGYDPGIFELVKRYYREKPDAGSLIGFWPTLPNGKSDINSSAGISTNLPDGSSWQYPCADYAKRDSIIRWHKLYTLGLAYFLAKDPSVPEKVRSYMNSFGLCRDEYPDNDHFPHQLYIREARRMKGEYIMTQHDLMYDTIKYDAIGMGSYNIDIREMQRVYIDISRFPDLKQEVYNEGYLSIPVAPYQIPFRAILPKFMECTNLLVPVCVSASHVALASIRMEPQYMILGESAGIAASMAVKENRPVQLIDIFALQAKLRKRNQILSMEEKPYGIMNDPNTLVIDNNMRVYTSFTGNWHEEETKPDDRYEMNFRYKTAGNEGTFTYSPFFMKEGFYKVFVWYPALPENDKKVRIEVFFVNGVKEFIIDQNKKGGQWVLLGEGPFMKGHHKGLTIYGSYGKFVVADAVKFEWIPEKNN
jgi:hypothetical protein